MRGFTLLSFMFSWRTVDPRSRDNPSSHINSFGLIQSGKEVFISGLGASWRLIKIIWLFCGRTEICSNSLLLRDSSVWAFQCWGSPCCCELENFCCCCCCCWIVGQPNKFKVMQPGIHPNPTTTLLVTLSRYLTFLISDWSSAECRCHMAHLAKWKQHDSV